MRFHQIIGNILRTFNVKDIDEEDPWTGILAATMFAIRATFHTTLKVSPMQLVLGRDAIMNIKHVTNWEHIKQSKQKHINNNNRQENKSRVEHHYQVDDQVLVKARKIQ